MSPAVVQCVVISCPDAELKEQLLWTLTLLLLHTVVIYNETLFCSFLSRQHVSLRFPVLLIR